MLMRHDSASSNAGWERLSSMVYTFLQIAVCEYARIPSPSCPFLIIPGRLRGNYEGESNRTTG